MNKTHSRLLTLIIVFFSLHVQAQNVGINEDGSAPNPNAILDVKSFTKGILIPRVSTSGRLAIPATKGLLVYDTTSASFWYNTGASWQNMGAAGGIFSDSARENTAAGFRALSSPGLTGYGNSAFGGIALKSNSTGFMNTALGGESMYTNNQGDSNTAVGYFSLPNNTTGGRNTAIGSHAMEVNNLGHGNTAIGVQSLDYNRVGNFNTAIGINALSRHSAGSGNTAIGSNALVTDSIGSNNTIIGSGADISVATTSISNATAIGAGAIVNASNKIRLGNNSVTVIEGIVPFTTPSDARFKEQVQEDVKGLDFILQLRPVTYHFDPKQFGREVSSIRRTGFIAQEVEQAARASGYDFSGVIRPVTDKDHYSLSYESFVVPLVKAVQDQQQIIAGMQRQIDELKQRLSK
jgi:hypothetical protein